MPVIVIVPAQLAGGHGVEVRLNVDGKGKGVITKKVLSGVTIFYEALICWRLARAPNLQGPWGNMALIAWNRCPLLLRRMSRLTR